MRSFMFRLWSTQISLLCVCGLAGASCSAARVDETADSRTQDSVVRQQPVVVRAYQDLEPLEGLYGAKVLLTVVERWDGYNHNDSVVVQVSASALPSQRLSLDYGQFVSLLMQFDSVVRRDRTVTNLKKYEASYRVARLKVTKFSDDANQPALALEAMYEHESGKSAPAFFLGSSIPLVRKQLSRAKAVIDSARSYRGSR